MSPQIVHRQQFALLVMENLYHVARSLLAFTMAQDHVGLGDDDASA
ncbi:MAG: hypothetical protein JSV68_10250 [Anaerolineaceae bacterium]|nr:MAG: hypothetical protein JSV68_10250 [Anaerolineaceae bacterium]